MDGEQFRCQFAGLRFPRPAHRDAGITDIAAGEPMVEPRCDLHDLPAVGAEKTRVGGQQALQQRRPATHHPDDDDRRGNLLVEDLRVAVRPLLSAQPHPKAMDHSGPQNVMPMALRSAPASSTGSNP